MMCYKDMTFCECDCTNDKCNRFLNDDVWENAKKCGLLVAVSDFSKECKEYEHVNPISGV